MSQGEKYLDGIEGDTADKNDKPLNWEFFMPKMFA